MNTTSMICPTAPGVPKTAVANAVLRAMSACTTTTSGRRGRAPGVAPLRRLPMSPAKLAPGAAPAAASPCRPAAGMPRERARDHGAAAGEAFQAPVHGGETPAGAAASIARRQRPCIYAVRRAVSMPRTPGDSLTEIDIQEASRVLERLKRPLGAARGHRFAVGIRRASDGVLDGAAVCAAPMAEALQDGLTAELRRLAVDVHSADGYARLLDGIADETARMGYRRLVTYLRVGLTAQVLVDAGWCRLPGCWVGGPTSAGDRGGHDVGPAWTKVLRGEHRSR